MITNFKKINGFTLSEVLIALVIIGIIAAITIPLLYANYQEQAIKAALKKNYSVLKQALDRYQADNGGERLLSSDLNPKKYLIPYLSIIDDCSGTRLNSSCVPIDSNDLDNSSTLYKTYNGNTMTVNAFDDGQYVLNDGSLILFEYDGIKTRQLISVDVNGFGKKPNRLGRDLFMFELNDKGELIPEGDERALFANDMEKSCSKTSTYGYNGAACTVKVLRE